VVLVFIDESGDSQTAPHLINKQYPIFLLVAVCFERRAYEKFENDLNFLKRRLFKDTEFILHMAELTRPSKAKDIRNLLMNDSNFRHSFYNSIEMLINKAEFGIVFVAERKNKSRLSNTKHSTDLYENCVRELLSQIKQRFGHFKVIVESRSTILDSKITKAFPQIIFLPKSANCAGLQLADLVATPIGRHILGKSMKPAGNELPYTAVKKKIL
jgi:hypothetical protein